MTPSTIAGSEDSENDQASTWSIRADKIKEKVGQKKREIAFMTPFWLLSMLAEQLNTVSSSRLAHSARSYWDLRLARKDDGLQYHPGDALSMRPGFFWQSVSVGPQAYVDWQKDSRCRPWRTLGQGRLSGFCLQSD